MEIEYKKEDGWVSVSEDFSESDKILLTGQSYLHEKIEELEQRVEGLEQCLLELCAELKKRLC